MTIAVVGFLHLKNDKRVRKTVEILSKRNKIIYIYWTKNKNEREHEIGNVKYIPVYHNIEKNFVVEVFKRTIYEYKIIKSLRKFNFEILYLHHFATFLPFKAYKLARDRGVKVVTDFHEYVPEEYMFSLRDKLPVEIIGRRIFKYQVLNSDKIIAVSPYLIKETHAIKRNIPSLLVPNYAHGSVDSIDVSKKRLEKEVIFVGSMRKRMKYEMEILKKLYNEGFTITFLGIPRDIKEEGRNNFIKYEEFKPYTDMLARLSKATFSLVSYSPYDSRGKALMNYIHSFPNKFFDSLAAGTPVIVREEYQEMKDVVRRCKIGVVIPKNNVDIAVDKILLFFKEKNYEELINNIKIHKDKFIWTEAKEREFEKFVVE